MRTLLVALAMLGVCSSMAVAEEVSREKVREVLERFVNEPSIQEVHAWTTDYAQIGAGFMKGMLSRARVSPILPRFQSQLDRIFQYNETLGQEAGTANQLDIRTNDDLRLRFRADWQLNQWLFNPLELRVVAEANDVAQLREDLLSAVTKVYFERRRLQVELVLDPATDLATAIKKELRLQELTATIDAYTGGEFSSALRKKASQ